MKKGNLINQLSGALQIAIKWGSLLIAFVEVLKFASDKLEPHIEKPKAATSDN